MVVEFAVEFKTKNGKKQYIPFSISDKLIEDLDKNIDKEYIEVDNYFVLLKDLYGDQSIQVDKLKIVQIGWLLKHREVLYHFVEKRGDINYLVIGIK